jgi:thiol-disulfide isomerase/thioredoxin
MTKNLLYSVIFLLVISLVILSSLFASEKRDKLTIYLFSVKGCSHCLEEKKFLSKLKEKYGDLRVVEIDLIENKENQEIFKKVASLLNIEVVGVPFTVIGNIPIVGWHDEILTGGAIERAIHEVQRQRLPDVTAPLLPQDMGLPAPTREPQIPERLTLPIIGAIEIRHLSLGVVTIVLGALDGFNPCAMWALIFLIGLLVNMQNAKRMWALGSLFIGGSGLVYFLFMSAWLNVFLFLGLIFWVRIAIGAIALVAAWLNLREYFWNKSGSCALLGGEKRQGLMINIRNAIEQQSFWLAAGGIFLLGVAVNLVELFCSAGLPVVYTQILTLSRLPVWQYYVYLALYILVFMLDDIIIFVVSMVTLRHFGFATRYKRFSNLLGGVVLLLVGLLLVFKPEFLMFG